MTSNTIASLIFLASPSADTRFPVKYARQNSVHVSPTVLFDGLVQHDVSSGWEQKDWEPFLEKMIVI